jgi:hypothetical protein
MVTERAQRASFGPDPKPPLNVSGVVTGGGERTIVARSMIKK